MENALGLKTSQKMWRQAVRDPAAILLCIKGVSRSSCRLRSEVLWSFFFLRVLRCFDLGTSLHC